MVLYDEKKKKTQSSRLHESTSRRSWHNISSFVHWATQKSRVSNLDLSPCLLLRVYSPRIRSFLRRQISELSPPTPWLIHESSLFSNRNCQISKKGIFNWIYVNPFLWIDHWKQLVQFCNFSNYSKWRSLFNTKNSQSSAIFSVPCEFSSTECTCSVRRIKAKYPFFV